MTNDECQVSFTWPFFMERGISSRCFLNNKKLRRAWLQIASGAGSRNDFRGERLLAMAYGDTYAAETFIAFSHNHHYVAGLRLLSSSHRRIS
ncbi:hypothetical protein [Mesorhizobium sp.]|uniref:hypothetical protein n=1 Tax=Mesorhizobium sp. TaxID=1871066 RepID=UPI000FE9F4CC|nr:hypothetical protein [Mesorhizobium sp.]RWP77080.1 MAG: hypothetical protein EOR09_08560 [Mesorhizobium sp.]